MIAQELEVSLHMAFMEARQKRHEFITVEHLLLAMLDNPSAAEVLRACAANIDDLRKKLSDFIDRHTPRVPGEADVDTQPTLGFQRVIQRAILHVQSSGQERGHRRQRAGRHLRGKGFPCPAFPHPARPDPAGCGQLHFPWYRQDTPRKPRRPAAWRDRATKQQENEEKTASPLDSFTSNLNQQAQAGQDRPVDRPRPGTRTRDPDPVPAAQEQPLAGR
jgi:ATP-dependent Clp protease ATP-binding subunit ClpA